MVLFEISMYVQSCFNNDICLPFLYFTLIVPSSISRKTSEDTQHGQLYSTSEYNVQTIAFELMLNLDKMLTYTQGGYFSENKRCKGGVLDLKDSLLYAHFSFLLAYT